MDHGILMYHSPAVWNQLKCGVTVSGYTPALACAPNKDVADCLALILATMMPVSPCTPAPSLPFSAINHYTTSPSKSVTFDSLPVLRGEHTTYCSFNNISHHEGFYRDEELNDSDSETYWWTAGRNKNTHCVLEITHRQLGRAEDEESTHRSLTSLRVESKKVWRRSRLTQTHPDLTQTHPDPDPVPGVLPADTGPQYPLLYWHWVLECLNLCFLCGRQTLYGNNMLRRSGSTSAS